MLDIVVELGSAQGSTGKVSYNFTSSCTEKIGIKLNPESASTWVDVDTNTLGEVKFTTKNEDKNERSCTATPVVSEADCSEKAFTVKQKGTGSSGCDVKVTIHGLPNDKTAKILWGTDDTEEITGSGEYTYTTNKSSLNVSVSDETGDYQFDPNNFTLSCDGITAKTVNAAAKYEIKLEIPSEYFDKGNTYLIVGSGVLTQAQIAASNTGTAIIMGPQGPLPIGFKYNYNSGSACERLSYSITTPYNEPNETNWHVDEAVVGETYYVVNIDGNTATTIGSFIMDADDFNDCSDTIYTVP